jgi:DNA polymerase-3 subunit beta
MITSDTELTICYQLPAETKSEFEMLIPFDFFNKLIGLLKSAPVEIELVKDKKILIRCEGQDFHINSMEDVASYPKIPAEPKKNLVTLNDQFIGYLTTALQSAMNDDMRPALSAVCMDMKEKEAFIVSTDAHIMYRHRVAFESNEPEILLFSTKMVQAIDGLKELELGWTKDKIAVKGKHIIIWGNRIDVKYPNYESVIPKAEANLNIRKSDFMDALNKACLSRDETKHTKIFLNREQGKIHIEFVDNDYERDGHLVVDGTYTGQTPEIGVNAKKMLTVLGQVEAEDIDLHISSASRAILVTSKDDTDYLGLVMPLMK